MNSDLEKLIRLQEIDFQLHQLEMSTHQFPQQMAELENRVAAAKKRVSDLEDKETQCRHDRTSVLALLQEAQEGLKRSRERLASISTNREYDALHAEIAAREHAVQSAQARLKVLDDELEKLKTKIEQARNDYAGIEHELRPQIEELRQKVSSIDAQRNGLMARRQEIAITITAAVLRAYDRILKRRPKADVLSFVEPPSKACSRCHVVLQPQLLNDLRSGTKLLTCQTCGSILIWRDSSPGGG